jgi:hypothetical protein
MKNFGEALIPQQQGRNRRHSTTGIVCVDRFPMIADGGDPLEIGHGNGGTAGAALEEHLALIIYN